MVNVMIVEDEMLVRTGMKTMINWEENGFKLVAEASNGEEALEKLKNISVDIVITDVRMPLMDGLKLLERINSSNIPCEVIILSSYDDFEYVKKALVQGARDYIHKPTMMPEDLINSLKRIVSEMNIRKYGKIRLETNEEILNTTIRKLVKKEVITEEFSEIAENSGVINKSIYICVVRAIDQNPGIKLLASTTLENAVRETIQAFKEEDSNMLCVVQDEKYWLVVFDNGAKSEFNVKLKNQLKCKYDISIVCVGSDKEFLLQNLENEYKLLKQKVDYEFSKLEKLLSYNPVVQKAIFYIEKNYSKQVTLDMAAKNSHINPAYLSRLFIKETGQTFIDYLTNIRLEQARMFLEKTACTLDEIAETVGYQSSKYFMKIFKRIYGMTPSEYRKQINRN